MIIPRELANVAAEVPPGKQVQVGARTKTIYK